MSRARHWILHKFGQVRIVSGFLSFKHNLKGTASIGKCDYSQNGEDDNFTVAFEIMLKWGESESWTSVLDLEFRHNLKYILVPIGMILVPWTFPRKKRIYFLKGLR